MSNPMSEPLPLEVVLEQWKMVFSDQREFDHVLDEGLPLTPVRPEDVVEIAYRAEGSGDGPPWVLVVRLRDGRWAYLSFSLQITGDVYWTVSIAATRERLWWGALTEDDRARFTPQMTRGDREAELVQLDQLLDSPNPALRALAAARLARLHELGGRL